MLDSSLTRRQKKFDCVKKFLDTIEISTKNAEATRKTSHTPVTKTLYCWLCQPSGEVHPFSAATLGDIAANAGNGSYTATTFNRERSGHAETGSVAAIEVQHHRNPGKRAQHKPSGGCL